MRKVLLTFFAVAILGMATCIASASSVDINDQITLGQSPAASLIFTSGGSGNFTLNLSNLSGTAVGNGTLASTGFYSILQNGASISGSLSGPCSGSPSSCTFGINQSTNLVFNYGSTAGGSDLLSGDLQLVDLTQTPSTQTGVFNEALTINLTNLSGSLEPAFLSGNGVVQLTLAFATTTNLATLGAGHTLDARVHTGSVNPLNVPEPASLGLLGGGLLALGTLLRKKLFASRS